MSFYSVRTWSRRNRIAAAGLLILAVGLGIAQIIDRSVPGWWDYEPESGVASGSDDEFRAVFLAADTDDQKRYSSLFRYFLRGYLAHRSPQGERVHYPGAGSINGPAVTGLEGFARTAPLLAAWIHSGRGRAQGVDSSLPETDLVALLKQGLLTGTDPMRPEFWGNITDLDQRIIEAADIARIVWLTRPVIWNALAPDEQKHIADWLLQAISAKPHPNNWQLISVTIALILRDLGVSSPSVDGRYQAFKSAYRGHGWFYDWPEGIDFYNTWGMPYELFWIHKLAPDFDGDFIRQALRDSAELTRHLIGPQGIPIMGRSVCYRTAIPVPVLAETLLSGIDADPGEARRALDLTWRHFIGNGALRDGYLTQGYHDTDLRFIDGYSGPGSCHWGTRSLVLALLHPPDSPFWTTPQQPLPIETGDYRLDLPELGWQVLGTRESGEIRIVLPANPPKGIRARGYGLLNRIGEMILARPLRPTNHSIKYEQPFYTNLAPYPLSP